MRGKDMEKDHLSDISSAISKSFNVSKEAANIVVRWYNNEVAFEDFDSIDDFLKFLKEDLPDMLDSAHDLYEVRTVSEEFKIDVEYLFEDL